MEEAEKSQAARPGQNEVKPVDATEAAYAVIAGRVRSDSSDRTRLTRLETLSALLPEPKKLPSLLSSMMATETYGDIRLLVAANGARYAYSEKAIAMKAAERFAFDNEVRGGIAARVREDSQKQVALTPVRALGALIPGAEMDKIDGHLASLLDDEMYSDLRLITDTRGNRYMYSEMFMTRTYAEILARTEARNPCETMAGTVRDESRIYPRPTNLEVFKAPIFRIHAEDITGFAEEVVRRPEYQDIKLIKASTGAIYLYSDLYLNPDFARNTVEWEEVGRHQNP